MQQNSALLRLSHHVQFLYNFHHFHYISRQLVVLFYRSIFANKLHIRNLNVKERGKTTEEIHWLTFSYMEAHYYMYD